MLHGLLTAYPQDLVLIFCLLMQGFYFVFHSCSQNAPLDSFGVHYFFRSHQSDHLAQILPSIGLHKDKITSLTVDIHVHNTKSGPTSMLEFHLEIAKGRQVLAPMGRGYAIVGPRARVASPTSMARSPKMV